MFMTHKKLLIHYHHMVTKVKEDIKESDTIILNTCHIREKATEKLYSDLGRIRKIKDKRETQNKKQL